MPHCAPRRSRGYSPLKASSSVFISIPIEVRKLADNVYQARGVANTQVIATSEGHVVYDTGLATQAAKQRRLLGEALPEGPITHVILSHSHQDHAGGTRFWTEDDTEIVAHFEYPEEQRYLKELEDFLWTRNRPTRLPANTNQHPTARTNIPTSDWLAVCCWLLPWCVGSSDHDPLVRNTFDKKITVSH